MLVPCLAAVIRKKKKPDKNSREEELVVAYSLKVDTPHHDRRSMGEGDAGHIGSGQEWSVNRNAKPAPSDPLPPATFHLVKVSQPFQTAAI